MAEKIRRSSLPPSCKVLAAAVESQHRDHTRMPVIRIGFGGRKEYVDEHGRTHRLKPGLAEATAMSRRSMIRAKQLLVAAGLMGCRVGGGLTRKYCGRGGRGRAGDRAGRPEILHQVGNGGRKPGGEGLACEYFPLAGASPEDPAPDPETPPPAPAPRKTLREIDAEYRAARGP